MPSSNSSSLHEPTKDCDLVPFQTHLKASDIHLNTNLEETHHYCTSTVSVVESLRSNKQNNDNENILPQFNDSLQINGFCFQTNVESQNDPSAINHAISNENAKLKSKTDSDACSVQNHLMPPASPTAVSNEVYDAKADLISSSDATSNSVCTSGTHFLSAKMSISSITTSLDLYLSRFRLCI